VAAAGSATAWAVRRQQRRILSDVHSLGVVSRTGTSNSSMSSSIKHGSQLSGTEGGGGPGAQLQQLLVAPRRAVASALVVAASLAAPLALQTAFSSMACIEVATGADATGAATDSTLMWRLDTTTQCFVGRHLGVVLGLGVPGLLAWVCVWPALLAWWLLTQHPSRPAGGAADAGGSSHGKAPAAAAAPSVTAAAAAAGAPPAAGGGKAAAQLQPPLPLGDCSTGGSSSCGGASSSLAALPTFTSTQPPSGGGTFSSTMGSSGDALSWATTVQPSSAATTTALASTAALRLQVQLEGRDCPCCNLLAPSRRAWLLLLEGWRLGVVGVLVLLPPSLAQMACGVAWGMVTALIVGHRLLQPRWAAALNWVEVVALGVANMCVLMYLGLAATVEGSGLSPAGLTATVFVLVLAVVMALLGVVVRSAWGMWHLHRQPRLAAATAAAAGVGAGSGSGAAGSLQTAAS